MSAIDTDNLKFKFGSDVTEENIKRCHELEVASFEEDEAATQEGMLERWKEAGDFFLVCFAGDEIVGFVNGTKTEKDELTEESMEGHDKDGKLLCIHSVVVDEQYRRKGIATKELKAYLEHAKDLGVEKVALIAKEHLATTLYPSVGFTLLGESKVVHGKDQWFDLVLEY